MREPFPGPWLLNKGVPGGTLPPWHWITASGPVRGSQQIHILGPTGGEVAVIRDPRSPVGEPNARLIVGSHDLLAGCRLALALMRDYAPMMWADEIAWIQQAVDRAAGDAPEGAPLP
jgi:hypothetical protein